MHNMSVRYTTLRRRSHAAPKHRVISKLRRRFPRGKPDIQRGARRRSSWGWDAICAVLMSSTHGRGGNRVDNTSSPVHWCVCRRKWSEHMYVGVLLSHAWPVSIATGCTVSFLCLFDAVLKIVSSWLICYSLFLLNLQMHKPSSLLRLQKTASLSFLSPLHLSLVMATVFSRVVFSLLRTASSHCPAVTRAHISTGRPAVLYWKSHCYATLCYAACCSVGLLLHLSLFFMCLLASSAPVLGHQQLHRQNKDAR